MDPLSIYYQNCNGLRTKQSEFYNNFVGCSYDIVCLTETWLNNNFNSYNYITPDYYVFRKDRVDLSVDGIRDRRGGGTLVAVRKYLNVHRRFDLDFNLIEGTWVEIKLTPECTLLLGNLYFPPTISTELVSSYVDFLTEVIDLSAYKVILTGDYNIPEFNWDFGVSENNNSYIRRKSEIIYSLFCNLNLVQHNFIKLNPDDNLLDLVCSNFSDEIVVTRDCDVELVSIDYQHPSLLVILTLPVFKKTFVPFVKKDYFKADYFGLSNFLSGYQFVRSNDPNVLVNDLNNALASAIDTFVPDRTVGPSKYPHWFSSNLCSLLRLKEKFHKKSKKCPHNIYFKESFKKFRKLCKQRLITDEKKFKHKIECDLGNNPKFFWQYCKTQYKKPNEISIVQNGQVLPDNEVPEAFADHFSSVYCNNVLPHSDDESVVNSVYNLPVIVPPVITVACVVKAAKSLKNSPLAGSDNVPSIIVKGCINILAPILCHIFNCCLSEGIFPSAWKTAIVVPVPKNSNVSNVTNYRPISILSNFSKIFEKIICEHLSFHFNGLLCKSQHGFIKGRSTVSNLVSFLQFTGPAVLNRMQVDTVYFDLSKAFDVVNHAKLVEKLNKFGLSPSYVNFFKDYLYGRGFRAKYGNLLSNEHHIPSGVPQGSNLGPILFSLFFDDIKNCIKSHIEIFADDLKISRIIHECDDANTLQGDINSVSNWCNYNGMQCNVSKTVIVSFTRKHDTYLHNYFISGVPIVRKFEHRDLGVIMDSKLNFNCHLQKMLSNASRCSGLVYWITKDFKNKSTISILFGALVRSRLEYCSEVWNGLGTVDSSRIEQVQKTFLRRITYRWYGRSCSYNDSKSLLKLTGLDVRRTYRDLFFLFKVINSKIDCSYLLSKVQLKIPRLNARRILPFKTTPCKLLPIERSMCTANAHSLLDYSLSTPCFSNSLKDTLGFT